MSASEKYPGQNGKICEQYLDFFLISHIRKRKDKSSYHGFLNLHSDIVSATPISDWDHVNIDNLWAGQFLNEAKKLHVNLDEKVRLLLFCKGRVKSEQKGNALEPYWKKIIRKSKKSSLKQKQDDENLEPSPKTK
ncbi:hypothetical protein RclHR1_16590001 [Rhizophagus clarus]|uniref:Uncharacterized protein n=1 Tax=Rhizophagus clarus TaxID=94130 RepID=A0A2Z6QJC0_9GLOM|nr:hypothetical protein RclHR1_16590001 [Rhizophagus clarus]